MNFRIFLCQHFDRAFLGWVFNAWYMKRTDLVTYSKYAGRRWFSVGKRGPFVGWKSGSGCYCWEDERHYNSYCYSDNEHPEKKFGFYTLMSNINDPVKEAVGWDYGRKRRLSS